MTTEPKPTQPKVMPKNVRARLRDEGFVTDSGDMVVKAEFAKDGSGIKRIIVESKETDYEWGVAKQRYVLETGKYDTKVKKLAAGDSQDRENSMIIGDEQRAVIEALGKVLFDATKTKGSKVMSTEQTQRHIAQDIAMAVKNSVEGRGR